MVADGVVAAPPPHLRGAGSTDELSVASYLAAFSPALDWDDLAYWPPDTFRSRGSAAVRRRSSSSRP